MTDVWLISFAGEKRCEAEYPVDIQYFLNSDLMWSGFSQSSVSLTIDFSFPLKQISH